MLLSLLILVPLLGTLILFIFFTAQDKTKALDNVKTLDNLKAVGNLETLDNTKTQEIMKVTALSVTVIDLFISLVIWFLFDNSSKHYQFVQEHYTVGHYDIYLGLDGLSIYFVLLTTLIAPISIISNWKSINTKTAYFLIIILLLESALLLIYTVLDILMFYIFFESILAPLFILIGFFGSTDKLRASFYFFLYTFLGSLFMLLSIITISSLTGCTDMDIIYKTDYAYITQVFLFMGIFVAFAVKTPVIFLNTWLLKAHVESPLSGSVILAAIVLKLSLYGVFRLILPLVPKAFIFYTHIIFVICVITIIYASFSTIRTIDVKELIAYSSVSHAAVYFAGILSNVIQGIQGGILLGLAHGFVSSGLFISGGGILYDRSSTRTINYYGGLAQVMPIFSILFFILCLGNCGAPLTLNFVGEFMSLYGIFERLTLAGLLASSSIVFSAVYTIFMFNRIVFGGIFKGWHTYLPDLNKREYSMLLILVIFTVLLGIYPSILLDGLHYNLSNLLYNIDFTTLTRNDAPEPWGLFFPDNITPQMEGLKELHNNIMFYLAIISFAVSWIVFTTILNYKKAAISNFYNSLDLRDLFVIVNVIIIIIMIYKICNWDFIFNFIFSDNLGSGSSNTIGSGTGGSSNVGGSGSEGSSNDKGSGTGESSNDKGSGTGESSSGSSGTCSCGHAIPGYCDSCVYHTPEEWSLGVLDPSTICCHCSEAKADALCTSCPCSYHLYCLEYANEYPYTTEIYSEGVESEPEPEGKGKGVKRPVAEGEDKGAK